MVPGDPPPPDWDRVIRLSWRPAWSIRSRRGAGAAFLRFLREGWSLLAGGRG